MGPCENPPTTTGRTNLTADSPTALQLRPVNAQVYSVHTPDGGHVGNLKLIGGAWKFKAIGYDADGSVVPGGGPLTDKHNRAFAIPSAALVSAGLVAGSLRSP